jgi:MoaA/NifB/PqqE/SkfB family radical SAM enzyme
MALDRISIEVTSRCAKACWFCYNHSQPGGSTRWSPDELVGFVRDCAAHGVRAVSFGGGEPLQYEPIFEVLVRLRGVLFRSMTTNGLPLDEPMLDRLIAAAPEKVHVSIHFPERPAEVARVIRQVGELAGRGVRSGVNLLVARSNLAAAVEAAEALRLAGIGNDRIVYLPMRGRDTPTPDEMARAAGGDRFQSMTCLLACGRSPRFASIGWDRTVAWCSYTRARRPLPELTYRGLASALEGLDLIFCGGTDGT